MRKCIKICEGDFYYASNPFIERIPAKNSFMKYSFLLYKRARIYLSKKCPRKYPLTEQQKFLWDDSFFEYHTQEDNSASKTIDNKSPYFKPKFFSILELIPKENWTRVEKGIERFHFKHSDRSGFTNSVKENFFESFRDGMAWRKLDTVFLKSKSSLKPYASCIEFHAINLSSSFFCLKITVFPNEKIADQISKYAVSNNPDGIEICGFDNKHWYEFRHLNFGFTSGSVLKCKNLEMIFQDYAWNISKTLQQYIPAMLFTSMGDCPQYVCSVATNIDGNSNKSFWRSIDIDSAFCDFSNDFTSCIAWRSYGEPLYVFQQCHDPLGNELAKLDAHRFADSLCDLLLISKATLYLRNKLFYYSKKINFNRNKLKSWLKLKVAFDNEMYFLIRFLREIGDDIKAPKGYTSAHTERTPIIYNNYAQIKETVDDTLNLYEGINKLFESNVDYKNVKANYSLQRRSLFTSLLAVIVAIISILITVMISIKSNCP